MFSWQSTKNEEEPGKTEKIPTNLITTMYVLAGESFVTALKGGKSRANPPEMLRPAKAS